MNLCATCNRDFVSLSAFDEHRTGVHEYTVTEGLRMEPPREDGRRCFAQWELEDAGWTQDAYDRWRYPADWEMQAWRWDVIDDELESRQEAA